MVAINSVPVEIISQVFTYLPPKDLAHTASVCHFFYEIVQELPARLLIPKLKPIVVQANALTLWSNLEGNFNVDNNGKLVPIAFHHVFSRFFKWKRKKSAAQKINKIVEVTLNEIYRLNQQGYINKPLNEKFNARRLYVWDPNQFYSFYYPAYYLADKILNSTKFIEPKIRKAAELVKGQANLYEKNRKAHGPSEPDSDQRVCWNDFRLDEGFFYRDFIAYRLTEIESRKGYFGYWFKALGIK